MNNMIIPNSCNWWLCGDHAYFSPIAINALFEVDIDSEKCELAALIPETDFMSFDLYSYCRKYKDILFCMPGMGESIRCYDIMKNVWDKILVSHKNELQMCLDYHQEYQNKVFLSEYRERKIYELDLDKKIVEKTYDIPNSIMGFTGECIINEGKIYGVCGNKICCINLKNDSVDVYDIVGLESDLFAFCYDGYQFWLSGYCKEIFIWNPQNGITKRFPNISIGGSEYRGGQYPRFRNAVVVGEYIWFIPFKQRDILYFGLNTYEVNVLKMEAEQESEEEMENREASPMIKYNLEYVRENRFLGIYSFKFRSLFEIDTVTISVQYKNYILSEKTILILADEYYKNKKILLESNVTDEKAFGILLQGNNKIVKENCKDIGKYIYNSII